ncbi:uncharacterized protein LOC108307749 [Cebus imitator]|uniref:uncharacterized protein LOC108307749 n=1 Tax=Cebus imitator TaxID=2715852 RepID=UPI000809B6EB|nr:uncharacterized protein LOC108307749 [Cebus imitator]
MTWGPIRWRQGRPGCAGGEGRRAAKSHLRGASEGMLRAPGWVQREAAPRNKCRVPWQRREFPGRGGRKQPPPGSRQRKQNPIPLPGEQNGRTATLKQGHWVPWESEESLLFASRRELEAAEGAGNPPSAAPRGVLGVQRSAAGSIPGRRRSAHCANPAGPTNPARPPLLEPRRRAWRLRALSWAGNIMHFPFA